MFKRPIGLILFVFLILTIVSQVRAMRRSRRP